MKIECKKKGKVMDVRAAAGRHVSSSARYFTFPPPRTMNNPIIITHHVAAVHAGNR
jgi:hypothetical protein